jgi:hypothetical protein
MGELGTPAPEVRYNLCFFPFPKRYSGEDRVVWVGEFQVEYKKPRIKTRLLHD